MRGTMGLASGALVGREGSVPPLSRGRETEGRAPRLLVGPVPLSASLGLRLLLGSITERPGLGGRELRRPPSPVRGGGEGRGGPSGWVRPGGWGEAVLPQATAAKGQAAFVCGLRLLLFFQGLCAPRKKTHAGVALGIVKRTVGGGVEIRPELPPPPPLPRLSLFCLWRLREERGGPQPPFAKEETVIKPNRNSADFH